MKAVFFLLFNIYFIPFLALSQKVSSRKSGNNFFSTIQLDSIFNLESIRDTKNAKEIRLYTLSSSPAPIEVIRIFNNGQNWQGEIFYIFRDNYNKITSPYSNRIWHQLFINSAIDSVVSKLEKEKIYNHPDSKDSISKERKINRYKFILAYKSGNKIRQIRLNTDLADKVNHEQVKKNKEIIRMFYNIPQNINAKKPVIPIPRPVYGRNLDGGYFRIDAFLSRDCEDINSVIPKNIILPDSLDGTALTGFIKLNYTYLHLSRTVLPNSFQLEKATFVDAKTGYVVAFYDLWGNNKPGAHKLKDEYNAIPYNVQYLYNYIKQQIILKLQERDLYKEKPYHAFHEGRETINITINNYNIRMDEDLIQYGPLFEDYF